MAWFGFTLSVLSVPVQKPENGKLHTPRPPSAPPHLIHFALFPLGKHWSLHTNKADKNRHVNIKQQLHCIITSLLATTELLLWDQLKAQYRSCNSHSNFLYFKELLLKSPRIQNTPFQIIGKDIRKTYTLKLGCPPAKPPRTTNPGSHGHTWHPPLPCTVLIHISPFPYPLGPVSLSAPCTAWLSCQKREGGAQRLWLLLQLAQCMDQQSDESSGRNLTPCRLHTAQKPPVGQRDLKVS